MSFQRKFKRAKTSLGKAVSCEASSPTVLLIEHSPEDRQIFEQHLRRVALNWRITAVADGYGGIQHMTLNGFPSLVVSRMDTPRLGAMDIAEWLQIMKTPDSLRLIIYDKPVDQHLRHRFQEFQVTEFLEKHSPSQEFDAQLRRMLDLVESKQ